MNDNNRNTIFILMFLCLATLIIVLSSALFTDKTTIITNNIIPLGNISSIESASANLTGGANGYINVKDFDMKGDGVTNDAKALKYAFSESQRLGVPLYFPAGEYNLGGASLTANSPLHIIGEDKSNVKLIQPGIIRCVSDVRVENITVVKNNKWPDIFLYLKSIGFVNVYINNVNATSNHIQNDSAIFLYASDSSGTNGINNLNITNCHISKFKSSFLLNAKIDCNALSPGIISNNIIEDLGDPTKKITARAIKLGFSNVKEAGAHNVIISNNTIKNISTAFSAKKDYSCGANGIIVHGNHVVIQNNHLENITGGVAHEGIYAKAANVQILNNTLINAGDGQGCIVHKSGNVDSLDGVIIKGNTIYYDLDTIKYITGDIGVEPLKPTAGILVESNCFTIEGNDITMKNKGYAIHGGVSIYKIEEAIVRNNVINISNAKAGIVVWQIVGNAEVTGNAVNAVNSTSALHFRTMFPGSSITISDNKVTTVSTKALNFPKVNNNVGIKIVNNTFNPPL